MRLNRYLASAGLGSRRSCEERIQNGWVSINNQPCTKLATEVAPDDEVRVHGRLVQARPLTYVILSKPTGYVCTRSDPHATRTIYDLLPPHLHDLAHVGRLDKDSSGLLLLSNDGELTQAMTHPSHQVDKEYEVMLNKEFDQDLVAKLLRGFNIEGGWGKMESVHFISPIKLKVVLRQGINRQIRKMFYRLGYDVKKLERTRIGHLREEGIKPGQFRILKRDEVEPFRQSKPAPKKRRPTSGAKPARKFPRGSSAKPREGRPRR